MGTQWGSCKVQNVWSSFDGKGWSRGDDEYYMAGIYRNDCDKLYCLEKFYCCKLELVGKGPWYKGSPGSTCAQTCDKVGLSCESTKQTAISTSSEIRDAFKEAGYTCKSVGGTRTDAGTPFLPVVLEMIAITWEV